MALRIRFESIFPLPSSRVWFLIPQNVANIQSLKIALCLHLRVLKTSDIQPAQLVLEMDGFEIPDESSIDLVREGDVLMLKCRDPIVSVLDTRKRKMSPTNPTGMEIRRRFLNNSRASSNSSSTESSTTPSSDSNSDTDSSSSHSPALIPSNARKPQSKHALLADSISQRRRGLHLESSSPGLQQPTVPPGFGKASTHSRNKRRRTKRKFASAATAVPQHVSGHSSSSASEDGNVSSFDIQKDAGPEPFKQSTFPTAVPRTLSSSLGNRNKKKGFKKSMESAVPQKVVFDSIASTMHLSNTSTFIPPSERQRLPRNVFVTSVDVEWRTGQVQGHGQHVGEDVWASNEVFPVQTTDEKLQKVDWRVIEARWDEYKKLNASVKLSQDFIVGWRGFGLDPVTLTPQASMLHLGKVVSIDLENIVVQPLTHPSIMHATFGRASIEDQVPAELISLPFKEVWSNDWKLVSEQ